MGDFEPAFVHALSVQSWSLYSVGIFLVFFRMYARIHRLSFKGLQADDYLMALAGCFYTLLVVCLNVIAGGGGSNLYLPEEFATFTPVEILDRIEGSKIVIVSEQAMLNVIYTIKICMLLMYSRLTLGLQVQKMVFYLSIFVAIGWVATEIAFFTACTPFKGYWAMPPPNPQCTTLQHYAIVQACFNISSDTLMLLIPLPLITRLNAPWKQKAILMIIFSMGIFVILAAILTKVFNLSNIWDPSYMMWYTREASVAIYVANLPMIWPLLREWFPYLKALTPGQKISSNTHTHTHTLKNSRITGGGGGGRDTNKSSGHHHNGITTLIHGKGEGESTEDLSSSNGEVDLEMRDITREESWEREDASMSQGEVGLVGGRGEWEDQREKDGGGGKGITMTTTVQISEEHVAKSASTRQQVERDLEKGGQARGFKWNFDREGKDRR